MKLPPFDFQPRTRVLFGPGLLSRVGDMVVEYGGTRVMIVSDSGIVRAGYAARARDLIVQAGVQAWVFDEVHENPSTEDVARATEFAREHEIDLIVGLGGGSSIDCAKGANFLLTNGGEMRDYWGVDKATQPMLPLIAIPTTAGTGSEAQSFALISDAQTHAKMACGDKKAAARVAILDPELTLSLPHEVAVVTGMDAISHAVESYVSLKRNPVSQLYARQAWRLLESNFERIINDTTDIEARGAMLLGACWAGLSIENSMLGAAHSLANPMTAHFGVTHGIAIGVVLPHVVRRNAEVVGELYADLARDANLAYGDHHDPQQAGDAVAARLEALRQEAGLAATFAECGADADAIDQLAVEAAGQWTAQFNPVQLSEQEFAKLYRHAC